MATTIKRLFRGGVLNGLAPTRFVINNKALTSNLATITTSAAHGITQVGLMATIQGVDSTFDGSYTIHSIPSTTTFTYAKTATNVVAVAVSPTGVATFYSTMTVGQLITNKVVQNTVATMTTASAHGVVVGDVVAVTIGDVIYDTNAGVIIGVTSATTFCYAVTTVTAATTAVTQGSFGKIPPVFTAPSTVINEIETDIEITNTGAASATLTLVVAGEQVIPAVSFGASSWTTWQGRITMLASETLVVSGSSSMLRVHTSGVEVV